MSDTFGGVRHVIINNIQLPKHLSMKKFLILSLALWSSLLATGQGSIEWTNLVNVTASDNALTKTGNNGWNAGASSAQQLAANTDGYAEITINQVNTHRFFGLSANDASVHFTDIDFALFLLSNTSIRIYELGSYKGSYGEYSKGDRLRVERVGNKVQYSKNGTVIYTSATNSTSALVADATIYHKGGTIQNGMISFGTSACTDVDGDGVCAEEDCDDTNANLPANPGTSCDDGDATTENDVIQADGCTCKGVVPDCTDADNDGVCVAEDCDDTDANIGAKQTAGTACDDGNANTNNDQIAADGCTCAGTPIDGGTNTSLWTKSGNKIYNTGKVLIGPASTTVPGSYNLYVTEGILSERVRVTPTTGNWADYVFEKEYQLNPLPVVEAHIKENKHLPNVPSAATVEKEGIDLGNMDATLLRQIEELWLHTIELNKKVLSLEAEIKRLKGEE